MGVARLGKSAVVAGARGGRRESGETTKAAYHSEAGGVGQAAKLEFERAPGR